MTFLTDDQLTAHFQAWLDEPAQKALKAEGGDAVEMMHHDVVTPDQMRFLSAFNVFWEQATVAENGEPEHDTGTMRLVLDALTVVGRLQHLWYADAIDDDQYHKRTEAVLSGALGAHCGLNADWSGMAWMLSKGKPNLTDRALYFVWADDGDFAIVRRFLDEEEGDEGVEDLFSGRGPDFQSKLKALIEQIEG